MTTKTDRTLADIWTELPTDRDPGLLRSVHTESGFNVLLFATDHTDSRGQTGLHVTILNPDGTEAYDTGTEPAGLVYGSPMHADDSDAALLSAITLCCHAAQHDENENPVDPGWDAEKLAEEVSCMESYLAGDM